MAPPPRIAVFTAPWVAGLVALFWMGDAVELRYPNLLTQCPMMELGNVELSSTVLNSVMANSSEIILNKDMLVAPEYLDYTGVTAVLHAQDFKYKDLHPYWTAGVILDAKPQVWGPGGMCELHAIDMLPADDSTGMLSVVEMRFILENCANGKHGVVSTYVVGNKVPGAREEKELVPWMCAVRGRDCGAEEAIAKHQVAAQAVEQPAKGGSVITIGRKIENTPILHPDGTSGKCNNTGMGSVQRDASTEEGCLLECMQRLEMDVAKSDVDVMHECSGYSWKEGIAPTDRVCLLFYEMPHSDKAITSADMDSTWRCVALRVIMDTYVHSTTPTTTPTTSTTTSTKDLSMVPLELFALTAEPTMATRKIISPIPGITSACFETVDWYVIDRQVFVNPEHWKMLLLELQAQPLAPQPPVVPSDMLLDRVCVMGQGGALPAECQSNWEDRFFPASMFLNVFFVGAISYLLLRDKCVPKKEAKFARVKEIVYEDMTRAQYPFAGAQQSILPDGQHEYIFRDKKAGS